MKKLLVLFVFVNFIFAQTAGNTGLSVLKISNNARSASMMNTGVAYQKDIYSVGNNPALLSFYQNSELTASHFQGVQDFRTEYFLASTKYKKLPIVLGVMSSFVNNIDVREKPGEAIGQFDAQFFSTSLSTGFNFSENLAFGLTGKYIYQSIYTEDESGYAYDLGLLYKGLLEDKLTFGASARNLGKMQKLRNEITKLPSEITVGTAYTDALSFADYMVTAEYQKYLNTDINYIRLGCEMIFEKMYSVRFGYKPGVSANNMSAGVGIIYKSFTFDYAYIPSFYELGSSNILSVKFGFL